MATQPKIKVFDCEVLRQEPDTNYSGEMDFESDKTHAGSYSISGT